MSYSLKSRNLINDPSPQLSLHPSINLLTSTQEKNIKTKKKGQKGGKNSEIDSTEKQMTREGEK